ncbi:MAG TPA: ABC transporter substrate-binding protein [Gaiellaceae bacterium]
MKLHASSLSLLVVLAFALVLAGCGGGSKSSSSSGTTTSSQSSGSAITAPASVKSSGTLVFCSDITYPPEESYKPGTTTPQGSDIDIGNYIAQKMGVKARFDNTGFDGIIAALLAKKCDVIISGMNDTPERRKQVTFVDYLKVGQSFMVKKGNPEHIAGIDSLAGKAASVETGTTNKDYLDAQSKRLTSMGKKAIKVVTFPKDTDAANALRTGRVDAYFGDAPVVAYYIEQTPDAFALGGNPVNPIPIGIAMRKSDTDLRVAVTKAIHMIYADGTMNQILKKWKLAGAVAKLQ